MKNAGVSPIRPWLLTALLRDAEATPRGIGGRRSFGARAPCARQASRRARFYRNDLPHVLRERARLAALSGRRRRAKALFARSIEVATDQGALAETLRTRISRGQVGVGFGWTDAAADGALAEAELRAHHLGARGPDLDRVTGISTDAVGRPAEAERGSGAGFLATSDALDSSMARCRSLHGIFTGTFSDPTFRTAGEG